MLATTDFFTIDAILLHTIQLVPEDSPGTLRKTWFANEFRKCGLHYQIDELLLLLLLYTFQCSALGEYWYGLPSESRRRSVVFQWLIEDPRSLDCMFSLLALSTADVFQREFRKGIVGALMVAQRVSFVAAARVSETCCFRAVSVVRYAIK